MKAKYLKQNEIDEITARLYNNQDPDIFQDTDEVATSRFSRDVADGLLIDGEKYAQVPGLDEFIITSYGRLINTYRVTMYKATFSRASHYWIKNGVSIKVLEQFEREGWKYDYDKIIQRYKDNNWKWNYMPCLRGKMD